MKPHLLIFLIFLALASCKSKPAGSEQTIPTEDSLTQVIWQQGPYELYMDSLRATMPKKEDVWKQLSYFKSYRQMVFANHLYYADSYKTYFALLNEYLPMPHLDDATEYDHYIATQVQLDSLLDFPGDEGCTYELYLYQSYPHAFTQWNIDKFTAQTKAAGLYSAEVDTAWNRYFSAMLTVIDSVVMSRPSCQGNICQMEYFAFKNKLSWDYLSSMLEALFPEQTNTSHITITNAMLSRAFSQLKLHLEVPSATDEDAMPECYVPMRIRLAALEADEKTWNDFIVSRNRFAQALTSKQRRTYNNATNNLMRNKLWLLKNEYHYFAIAGESYEKILLPEDCTDQQLLQYNYLKAH